MNSGYRYGLWGFTELWVISANGFGGHQKSWVITGYGLPQRWESTVVINRFQDPGKLYDAESAEAGQFHWQDRIK